MKGKAEEEEARRIKQRIHECNEASRRGIRSSTHIPIPNHGLASSTGAKNSCTFFHEWAIPKVAYESPIEELYYDRSVVPTEKPLGKIEIEAMIQAAV